MSHPLTFLHLSDIHFNKRHLDYYDLDRDLRDQLERDVERFRDQVPSCAGILVTGDIAFAGRAEEYVAAQAWLKSLCQLAGCPEQNVWCVPGNHDVDRRFVLGSRLLQVTHKELREGGPANLDALMLAYLEEEAAAELLFKPFHGYNEFAALYRCATKPGRLYWQDDLELDDGSRLRIHGINSALISSHVDEVQPRQLVVGTIQARPREEAGVTYMTLCHHPPEWLLDYDTVSGSLNNRVRIQLYGHKHFQRIEQVNNALRLGAGAVHPSRTEKAWLPRYNWISLRTATGGPERLLHVEIYPRVWSEERTGFMADFNSCGGLERCVFSLKLEPWRSPATSATAETGTPVRPSAPGPLTLGNATFDQARLPMDEASAARALTYRFLELPHVTRIQIAQQLGLYRDEDEGLLDADLLERIFQRARNVGCLQSLWSRVQERHGENGSTANPYAGL